MLKTILSAVVATTLSLSSVSAHAWGYDGHRITAIVASGLLTPKTRARLGELMPGVALSDIASYMDEERIPLKQQIPGSDKWHFDNIPVCERAPAPCPNGNCATARIDQLSKLLADRQTNQATRIFAVKALVHIVSDLHNPLHSSDNHDHGGNDITIGRRNLHSEWDSGLVKRLTRGQSVDAYASALLARYRNQLVVDHAFSPSSWAAESHDLAVRYAYGALPGFSCGRPAPFLDGLPDAYVAGALPVVESQLAKAGGRIALVLNSALGY